MFLVSASSDRSASERLAASSLDVELDEVNAPQGRRDDNGNSVRRPFSRWTARVDATTALAAGLALGARWRPTFRIARRDWA
ncbi:hypothetical protein MTO96_022246 [Rhipicephalus appendiculatus]